MAAKRGEQSQEFEVTSGITLSRTLIPKLPPNYLSRKHLFHLLDHPAPSTTVVLAPAGYGKTSLVAEWASTQKDRVIWLTITDSDSLEDMSSIFIQATRNILPNFAPWFESEPHLRPVEIVRRWGNELLSKGRDFILVIDNLRENTTRDVDIAIRLVEQFPLNLQFVTIRRDSIETAYATFAARGPLSVISAHQLIFSDSEIGALACMYDVSIQDRGNLETISAAHGWPSAVSMLLHHLQNSQSEIDFERLIASNSEPLRALATTIIQALDTHTKNILTALSVVEEFNHELAEVILGEAYSFDLINSIALEGHFFSQSSHPEQTFFFSRLMREVLLVELRKDGAKKKRIHESLLTYHEDRNEPNLALEHAYLAGNFEKVSGLFPDAARILQATGRSRELIRWSIFAGDNSQLGLLKRSTVELSGRLAGLEYRNVTSMIEQMNFDAEGTELEGFIRQITYGAKAYIDFAMVRFDEFDKSFAIAMDSSDGPIMFGVEEQISLYRLAAMRHFIFDEVEQVEEILRKAKLLASKSKIAHNHLIISSINAMALFAIGDYRRAFEAASVAHSQFFRRDFVGIFGPLESMYVMARCQLEFARPREAFALFSQVRDSAEQWQQWPWHYLADGYFARDLATKGLIADALENIKQARVRASSLEGVHNVQSIIDISEIFVRYTVKDHDRLAVLLERAPRLTFVRQIQLSHDEQMGRKTVRDDVKSLPDRTYREMIWKFLAEASEVIDQENLAKKHLKKALDIGAKVGAKETFLRQSHSMGNLMMKVSVENPTVYLEELASSVADRIKNENKRPSEFSSPLTKRELEVLRHLSTDRPISAIAASLHISLNTMKTHLKNLYRKMDVDGRVSAVEKARATFIL